MAWTSYQVSQLRTDELKEKRYIINHSRHTTSATPVYAPNESTNQEHLKAQQERVVDLVRVLHFDC